MDRAVKNIFRLLLTLFVVYVAVPLFAQEQTAIKVHLATDAAVPGNLLAPGDYIFRPLDQASTPNTIEIMSADGTEFFGYFKVSPVQRTNVGETVVDLTAPDQAGVPMVRDLYLAGERDGFQFTYSKKDIRKSDQLAQARAQATGSLAGQP